MEGNTGRSGEGRAEGAMAAAKELFRTTGRRRGQASNLSKTSMLSLRHAPPLPLCPVPKES